MRLDVTMAPKLNALDNRREGQIFQLTLPGGVLADVSFDAVGWQGGANRIAKVRGKILNGDLVGHSFTGTFGGNGAGHVDLDKKPFPSTFAKN